MKNITLFLNTYLIILLFISCGNKPEKIFKIEEISPWCIIGFDSLDRNPQQRIELIKDMGFTKYGFNKGKGDLTKMVEEFELAKANDIEITSIFLWLNSKRDSLGKLGSANQELLSKLAEVSSRPTIWVSFSDNFFKDLDHKASIQFATKMIKFVKGEADKLGCKLALYNHHGWFGDPYNQLEILKLLDDKSISIVYNFHHAQHHVDQFHDIAKKIKPHLSYVNLNGVKKEGPQIMTIGEGDHELHMIELLINEGYEGPWGILGHIKNEDVEVVLRRNIAGLEELNHQLLKQ